METKRYFQNLQLESNGKQPQFLPMPYTEQREEGNEGGIELGKLFMALRRRSFVIVGVATAVATAVVAYSIVTKPTYQAKFQLLIKPATVENKLTSSPLKEESQSPEEVGETELRILQSPKLMSPIAKQVEAQYPDSDSLNLNFNLIAKTNIIEVSYRDSNPEKIKLVLDTAAQTYLLYSLEERRSDVRQGIQFVEAQLPQLQKQVETLQEQLQKFRQKYGLIDPESQGKQLSSQLDGVVQQRLDTQAQLARTRALNASLQKQLKLQSNEAAAASSLSEAPRYQELLNKLQEVRTKIAVESARYQEDSPTIQALRAQEQNLLPLLEQEQQNVLGNKLSSKVAVNSGSLASPNSTRQQQIQQFFDTANQVEALEAQNKALVQAESGLRQQFAQFPAIVRQNDDLVRQLKIAVDNLNQFMTKREALRIDLAQKQVPWQLLSPPTKPESTAISIKQGLVLGTALGLLLGIGAALVADKFDNLFYTTDEVKDTIRLPLLGEIPLNPEKQFSLGAGVIGLLPFIGNKAGLSKRSSLFWESLHSLYTNIRFLSFDSPVRSLAIISAASEDGRSTVAVNLAQTAAAMGKRVLLVDADLRSPKIHKMLNLPNTKGLSNVIAANLDFHDVIQQVDCVSPKTNYHKSRKAAKEMEEFSSKNTFFVLTAGQVPPNPASLLSSPKMQNLAAEFHAAFDLIIYDTSPLLGLADSSLLATHTDASILVVGLGKTDRSALAKGLERFKISATPILGVVANGVKEYTAA